MKRRKEKAEFLMQVVGTHSSRYRLCFTEFVANVQLAFPFVLHRELSRFLRVRLLGPFVPWWNRNAGAKTICHMCIRTVGKYEAPSAPTRGSPAFMLT